jgi:hypothetical protein
MIEGWTRTLFNFQTISRNKGSKILHISNPLGLSNGDSKTTTSHVYPHVDIEEATNAYVQRQQVCQQEKIMSLSVLKSKPFWPRL